MKLSLSFIVLLFVKFVASGGDNPCGQFLTRTLEIIKEFNQKSQDLREKSFVNLEVVFKSKTMTVQEQQDNIAKIILDAKENFDILEDQAYLNLGILINKNPKVIARKLLQASEVTEFPFTCIMDDADSISFTANIANKAVADFGNKLLSEL
jgi:hypothetical protein